MDESNEKKKREIQKKSAGHHSFDPEGRIQQTGQNVFETL